MHVDPGLPGRVPHFVRDRGHQRLGTVADRHRRGQPLRAQDGDRVRGEIGDQVGLGRIGQVVAERDPDAVAGRRDPDHDEARLGDEAEQMRDEREQGGGRAGPDDEGSAWSLGRGRSSPAVSVCVMPSACGWRTGRAMGCQADLWITRSVIHR